MAENIFMFVPNLIGYARILLAVISFYYMPHDYVKASLFYLLSGFLDAFDGYAARYFNQSTKFGAMLDQLTDRCALMCLLVTLGHFYAPYMIIFQLLITIDIASHWMHLHVSMMRGKTSHKFLDPSENHIMRMYYTSRPVLFVMCAGNELCYAMLYLCYFTSGPSLIFGIGLFPLILVICLPICVAKTGISVLQLVVACVNLGKIDESERDTKDN